MKEGHFQNWKLTSLGTLEVSMYTSKFTKTFTVKNVRGAAEWHIEQS